MPGFRLRLLVFAMLAFALAPASTPGEEMRFFEQPDAVLYRLSEQRWDRKLHRAMGLPDTIELALTHRDRLETITNPWRAGQSPRTDTQVVQRTRLRLGAGSGPVWALFEGQDARLLGHDAGEFQGVTAEDHFDVQQLFLAGAFRDTFGSGLRTDLHAGRFNFEYGSTRTIGRNVLPNATQSFDGVHVNVGREGRWRARAFWTQPVDRRVDRPDTSSEKKTFWGTLYENDRHPDARIDLAYLRFDDTLSPALASQSAFGTYDARIRKEPPRGQVPSKSSGDSVLDYELETAYQSGDKGGKGFEAAMVHAELGRTWNRPWAPRLSAYLDYASGSANPAGPRNTTYDKLFGLRDTDLGSTADFGPFARSNLVSRTLRMEVRPRSGLRLILKHAWRQLDEPRDAFSGSSLTGFAALRDPTGRAGRDLGHDTELAALRQLSPNHFVDVRWAHWWKGAYFDRLPASAGLPPGGTRASDYFLLSTEVRFWAHGASVASRPRRLLQQDVGVEHRPQHLDGPGTGDGRVDLCQSEVAAERVELVVGHALQQPQLLQVARAALLQVVEGECPFHGSLRSRTSSAQVRRKYSGSGIVPAGKAARPETIRQRSSASRSVLASRVEEAPAATASAAHPSCSTTRSLTKSAASASVASLGEARTGRSRPPGPNSAA
ncbi:MAG: alginate export family protein [Candidatus Wallbacteria bacterium]|nr:alginate export family protein [Candidatus Wallbacteria bacterium]